MNVFKYTLNTAKLDKKKQQICLNHLPLEKIFLRVNRLIKQIYSETRKHNIEHVHYLQMYMINSIELKIFVFKYIISELYRIYYLDTNTEHKVCENYEREVLKSKFHNQEINLKKKLKQYIIYVCTQPMFNARLSKSWEQIYKQKSNKYLIKRNSYYYYQNIRSIEKKLKVPSYIKENIIYCLETLDYVDLLQFYKTKYKTNIHNVNYQDYIKSLDYKNFLNNILDKLNLTDKMWCKFNCIKRLQYGSIIEYNNHSRIHRISNSFKSHLKFRFLLTNIKLSKYLNSIKNEHYLFKKILSIYKNWYDKTYDFTNFLDIRLFNNLINQIICFLTKKQNLKILLNVKNLATTNSLANKTTYVFNIRKYYSATL